MRIAPGFALLLAIAALIAAAALPAWAAAPVELRPALMTRGASVNAQNSDGETALFIAALEENPITTKTLLVGGADPNISRNDGVYPV